MQIKGFVFPIAMASFASFLISCSPTSDNALIGDAELFSECPASGCANTAANVQNILMTSNTHGTISHTAATDRFEFSGECSPSTYLHNSIDVKVYAGCSGGGGDPLGVEVKSALGADRTPHCEKGKFNLVMYTGGLTPSQCFTVVAALRAGPSADVNTHTFKNDTAAKFSFAYIRN